MKFNPSLTAAITAVALVAGAGFAYAQSGTTPGAPGEVNSQGAATMKAPVTPDTSTTLQAQPSTGSSRTGTSMDSNNSATMQSGTVTPEPRADRN